jgi:nucleoside 2-deoxyribosyltransferase
MSVQTCPYDVFLSYSFTEGRTADLVERALTEAGLNVFNHAKIELGKDLEDVVRSALAESAAVVVVVDPERPPAHGTLLELGAAMAWEKPIYLVRADAGTVRLPDYLRRFRAYSVSGVDDMVQAVRREAAQLSEADRAVLLAVYAEFGIPLDRLMDEPRHVDALGHEFTARRKKHILGERLVQELMRLRKRGELPPIPKA